MKGSASLQLSFMLAVVLLTCGACNPALATSELRITVEERDLSVYAGERLLLCYRYEESGPKPYVRQLFSPSGTNILRDAPADHLHHRGLMFAVKVDGVNFWEEREGCGRQVHKSFTDVRVDEDNKSGGASFTEEIEWISGDTEELLLKETRTIEITQPKGQAVTFLNWQSRFEAPSSKESVIMTGTHYHGLGMRFLKSMDRIGSFLNPDGKRGEVFRGEERLLRSAWCAYTAQANGKGVTVAMFDHPDNPRHPATWFTMDKPFAYLSATLSLHTQPLQIARGKALVLKYAVALWDGAVEANRVNQRYQQWAAHRPSEGGSARRGEVKKEVQNVRKQSVE